MTHDELADRLEALALEIKEHGDECFEQSGAKLARPNWVAADAAHALAAEARALGALAERAYKDGERAGEAVGYSLGYDFWQP